MDDRLRRARGLAETKRYAEAVRELEALPGALPAEVRVERDWELGMAKFRMRRDYARAAELLLGIVDKLDPDRAATAAFHGARALSRSNRDDEAIAGYRRVVDRFPQSRWAAEAQFLSGWLDFNRARYAAALPGLEATIARHPRSPFAEDAAWFVALCRFFAGDHAGALDAFARYEKRGASGPEAAEAARRGTYYRGRSLAALGRKDEANALYREAARRWPFHFYGLLARARLREAGAPAELDLPPGRAALGPIGPAAARDPAVARADELAAAGLDVEAGVELQRAEEAIRKRLGRDQGLAVLLNRYPRFSNWHRPYYLAETSGDAALAGAPAGAARAFWEAAYPRAYRGLVERFAPPAGTPPLVLYAIMRKESGFSPHVVSYADARGLLQMIPPTSARVAGELGLPFAPDDLFVPETNVQLGAAYIGGLFRKFRGEILLTAAAYNGGPRAVMRWCDGNGRRPTDEFVELVTYDQTREYAKRVAGIYAHYHYLYEGKPFDLPLTVDCRYEAGGPEY